MPKNLEEKPKNNRNEPTYLNHIANEVATLMKKDINDIELFSLKITDSLYKKDIGKFLETLSSHFI